MGLKALPDIRESIIKQYVQTLLPQTIQCDPHTTIVHIDFTQLFRMYPMRDRTNGQQFCKWVWDYLVDVGRDCRMLVCIMDKNSFVPPEKAATQAERDDRPKKVSNPPLNEDTTFTDNTMFYVEEVMRIRPLRGALVEYFIRWLEPHELEPSCTILFDFEYPVRRHRLVKMSTKGQFTEHQGNTFGEADVAQLLYVEKYPSANHIMLQIDSDQLPISMLYLLRGRARPQSWTWIAANKNWRTEDIVETTERFDDDFPEERKSISRHKPIYCLDLLKLYDQLPSVECFVLLCVLTDTDYYKKKNVVSDYFNVEIIYQAIQSAWPLYWKPVWDWFNKIKVSSERRMRPSDNPEEGRRLGVKALEMQCRWQWHWAWVSQTPSVSHYLLAPPDTIDEYKRFVKRNVKKYSNPSRQQLLDAWPYLWYNCVYWLYPF